MTCRVTVITPAYNVAEYIAETIASVRAQTMTNFEYIIVDDSSTDNTIDVARTAASGDARITIVQVPNGGSGAARNAGIERATAPFVAFIDGDDRWHPHYLQTMVDALEKAPAHVGAVFAHSQFIDDRGEVIEGGIFPDGGAYDIGRHFSHNNPPGNGSVVVVRKRCFDEAGGFDEHMNSAVDHEMWLRIYARSSTTTFLCIPEVLVDYRKRPGSVSTSRGNRAEAYVTLLERYGHLLSPRQTARAKLYPALQSLQSENKALGRKWIAEIALTSPMMLLKTRQGRRALARGLGLRRRHAVASRSFKELSPVPQKGR